ncbi:MAG: LCP family protein [Firmicutes bacterium]|nr:LCP family protein [Bacillota bacterium]
MSNQNEPKKKGIAGLWSRIRRAEGTIPFPVVAVLLLLLLAVEVVFSLLIVHLGVLPAQYIALICVILAAIDAGIIALLGNRRGGRKRYVTGLIVTMVMLTILLPGSYFINNADKALQNLTKEGEQWEEYYVIAPADSSYEAVGDIRGKTVYVLAREDKMSVEAREKLVTKSDVQLNDKEADIISLGSRIWDEKEQAHNDLILVSESQYDMICEEIKGFKKNSKIIFTEKVMRRSNAYSSDVDVTKDPFNVYVTGIDVWGDIDKVSRSDVNMIVTINPQTRTVLLTSMPRDSYVPLHSFGQLDKLTHSGIYGVDETLDTVTDWLGVDFDYYVKVNFSMVVKLIDAMGGIAVYSDHEFTSSVKPQYSYFKGVNHLGGYRALYFARERHSFEQSDEQRIKNQQKVMEGIIEKVTTHKEILLNYDELLGIVAENMATNFSDRDLKALARMQLGDMDTKWNVETYSIDGDDASRGTFSMGMGRELFVSIPKEESVERAKEKIHDVMYPAQRVEETKPDDLSELLLDPQ